MGTPVEKIIDELKIRLSADFEDKISKVFEDELKEQFLWLSEDDAANFFNACEGNEENTYNLLAFLMKGIEIAAEKGLIGAAVDFWHERKDGAYHEVTQFTYKHDHEAFFVLDAEPKEVRALGESMPFTTRLFITEDEADNG